LFFFLNCCCYTKNKRPKKHHCEHIICWKSKYKYSRDIDQQVQQSATVRIIRWSYCRCSRRIYFGLLLAHGGGRFYNIRDCFNKRSVKVKNPHSSFELLNSPTDPQPDQEQVAARETAAEEKTQEIPSDNTAIISAESLLDDASIVVTIESTPAEEEVLLAIEKDLGEFTQEMKESLRTMKESVFNFRKQVAQLNITQLHELMSYKTPPDVVLRVVRSAGLILDYPVNALQTWEGCRKLLKDQFLRKITNYDPTVIQDVIKFKKVKKELNDLTYELCLQKGSHVAGLVFMFCATSLQVNESATKLRNQLKSKRHAEHEITEEIYSPSLELTNESIKEVEQKDDQELPSQQTLPIESKTEMSQDELN
jgi:hypothetical protein